MALPLAAIPAIIQGATGLGQLVGSLATKAERPKYEIPSALRSALAVAQTMVSDPKMAGYDLAAEQMNLATANMISAAQQGGAAQESVASIAAAQGGQLRDLAAMNEQSQRQDIQNLQGMLQAYAQAQDTEFQMNEFAPFMDKYQQKRDVFGAGLENIMGSGSSFALLGQAGGLAEMIKKGGANNVLKLLQGLQNTGAMTNAGNIGSGIANAFLSMATKTGRGGT